MHVIEGIAPESYPVADSEDALLAVAIEYARLSRLYNEAIRRRKWADEEKEHATDDVEYARAMILHDDLQDRISKLSEAKGVALTAYKRLRNGRVPLEWEGDYS